MQHSAGWCARPQPAQENLGGSSALSIPPPARKQSPGKQQAAPWEALLEDSVEEPRMGAQAGCRGRERQRLKNCSRFKETSEPNIKHNADGILNQKGKEI